jgi:hypothetical protein
MTILRALFLRFLTNDKSHGLFRVVLQLLDTTPILIGKSRSEPCEVAVKKARRPCCENRCTLYTLASL